MRNVLGFAQDLLRDVQGLQPVAQEKVGAVVVVQEPLQPASVRELLAARPVLLSGPMYPSA